MIVSGAPSLPIQNHCHSWYQSTILVPRLPRSQSLAEVDRKLDEATSRMDRFEERMDTRMEELCNLIFTQNHGPSQESNLRPESEGTPRPVTTQPPTPSETTTVRNYATRISEVEFPLFDGKKVKTGCTSVISSFSLMKHNLSHAFVSLQFISKDWRCSGILTTCVADSINTLSGGSIPRMSRGDSAICMKIR